MTLDWYIADSADHPNGDVEVDLDRIDNPGGASWAAVTDCGEQGWLWSIYDRWLHDDAAILDSGFVSAKEQGQAAVESWVADHAVPQVEFVIERVTPVTHTFRVKAASLERALKMVWDEDVDISVEKFDWPASQIKVVAATVAIG